MLSQIKQVLINNPRNTLYYILYTKKKEKSQAVQFQDMQAAKKNFSNHWFLIRNKEMDRNKNYCGNIPTSINKSLKQQHKFMFLSSTKRQNCTLKTKAKSFQWLGIHKLGDKYVIPKVLCGCCISTNSYALYQRSKTS